jgi:hypothetical protein
VGPVATYRLAAVAANAFGEYGVLELYRRRLGVGSRVATHDFRVSMAAVPETLGSAVDPSRHAQCNAERPHASPRQPTPPDGPGSRALHADHRFRAGGREVARRPGRLHPPVQGPTTTAPRRRRASCAGFWTRNAHAAFAPRDSSCCSRDRCRASAADVNLSAACANSGSRVSGLTRALAGSLRDRGNRLDCDVAAGRQQRTQQAEGADDHDGHDRSREGTDALVAHVGNPLLPQGRLRAQVQRQVAAPGFGVGIELLDYFFGGGSLADAGIQLGPGTVFVDRAAVRLRCLAAWEAVHARELRTWFSLSEDAETNHPRQGTTSPHWDSMETLQQRLRLRHSTDRPSR